MTKKKKHLHRALSILLVLSLFGGLAVWGLNGLVTVSMKERIITPEIAATIEDADCILVLGCLVKSNGVPSDMLSDRLRRGVELYELNVAPKILMSGDHGRVDYDEVDAMKRYAVEAGIASSDVFMDHAGFSTYESLYRARDVFKAKKVIIVSQDYHLYRALFIAQSLGLDAYGVSSDYRNYAGQTGREIREVLARIKDIGYSLLQPKPTYLGPVIPISGNGELTHDHNSDFS
jgi:vancomycin permeability regulator SanA